MGTFGIYGATGRVGRLLSEHLINTKEELSSVYVRKELDFSLPASTMVTNDVGTFLKSCEVVIDFTSPEGTQLLLEQAMAGQPKALVIGTTGLEAHQQNLMKEAAETMPILYATNMSLGVALLNKLVYMAAQAVPDFDIEITEMHHRHKKDAPSGTALTLSATAAKARELELDKVRVSGRNGSIGERSSDEIGVMALRGGDVVGEHTVGFYGDGEHIRLTHTATNRSTFAVGAIKAGKWLIKQPPGLYSIQDYFQL
jgi:4-hydroxy-tetrahydrodipicolinate reductase